MPQTTEVLIFSFLSRKQEAAQMAWHPSLLNHWWFSGEVCVDDFIF